jgi:excisionase family DNA binding protein
METKLYTIQEIADICGVHYMTVRNWIKRGELAIVNLPGSGIRITQDELNRILTPTTIKPAAE